MARELTEDNSPGRNWEYKEADCCAKCESSKKTFQKLHNKGFALRYGGKHGAVRECDICEDRIHDDRELKCWYLLLFSLDRCNLVRVERCEYVHKAWDTMILEDRSPEPGSLILR